MIFKKRKKLITHNNAFHADDVFACATLIILLEKRKEKFKIIRTRDEEIIKNGDYVFDVGGIYDVEKNRFDHHQKGGAGKRENGIEYSSFGLVWQKFGEEVCGSIGIANRVDKRIVQQVDANDNGINISNPVIPGVIPYGIYDVIFTFHPNYKEFSPDFDNNFLKAVNFIKGLLQKEIEEARDQEFLHNYIKDTISKKLDDSKLLVFDEYVPREKLWYELASYPDFLFAVAPRSVKKDSWKLVVLPTATGSFEFRKSLPPSWGGLKDAELEKVTGVSGVVFVHRNLFMAITNSKEGAIKLAELALLA